jgi:hypothetical protein
MDPQNRIKYPRQYSIDYWKNYSNKVRQNLVTWILCLKRAGYTNVPGDIRRIIKKELFWALPLHLPNLSKKGKEKNLKQLDLVTPLQINLPPNTLQCVSLKLKYFGRDKYYVSVAFWLPCSRESCNASDPKIINWLLLVEQRLFCAKPVIIPSKTRGYTLFYSFKTEVSGIRGIDEINVRKMENDFITTWNEPVVARDLDVYLKDPNYRLQYPGLLKLDKWINEPLTLTVKGVTQYKGERRMIYRLE